MHRMSSRGKPADVRTKCKSALKGLARNDTRAERDTMSDNADANEKGST